MFNLPDTHPTRRIRPVAPSPDTLNVLDDLVAAARHAGADAAEAVAVDGKSLSVGWRMGALESLQRSEGQDIGLRVFFGTRSAIVSSSDQSPLALAELVSRAIAMAREVPEDPYAGLADPAQVARDYPEIDSYDPTEPSAEDLIAAATRAEDAARAVTGVTNSDGAEAGWGSGRVAMVGSNGFSYSYATSSHSLSAVALAGGGETGGMERDYDYTSAVYYGDLDDPETIGRTAGERAVRRLGGKRGATGAVPVVFESRAARSLVGHLLGAINGASVARGTTFLKDSLGAELFAPHISIIEDPHKLRGFRSRPVDGEGLATHRRALIEGGRLTTWLLDLRSARQLGLSPTGHASRGVSSPPSPSSSNVWLEAGPQSPQAMIADIADGLYVTDLIGMGVNGVTGDYSRGCTGFWIRNGQLAEPINETTIAGNLKDMFKTLTPASDLVFRAGTESPTVRVDGLMVAGD